MDSVALVLIISWDRLILNELDLCALFLLLAVINPGKNIQLSI